MITRIVGLAVFVAAMAGVSALNPVRAAEAETKCHMTFNTSGWAAIYKHINGTGRVTCDNGQAAAVRIHIRGAGLTAGKYSIDNGKGEFTKLKNIDEIYGTYATAGANAGVVKSAEGLVMTKGEVSLAVNGTGRGFNLGVDVSGFEIERAK
ncbi:MULTISPECIES: hypothetical protein [unclassified Lysobacter]|uniref:hypothetical protein n=1 Tax=unclassified Lysobacter TaxID=2635362 RepID=UPI001BE953D6|nr:MULTISPECIES: hypothetical protein [unclassified Lysobacter]MBT2750067.1 hypothetical protein [Lysobacter sp. ISL-50]MBT2775361.1 hypothetical protein [Lysobacter sp. ISL-54]MBT2783484.1 hypothetical protein [Lysobacter sp. ISL-52]